VATPARLLLGLLLLAGAGAAFLAWWWGERLEHSQDAPILAAARRYGLDPALIKAVVWRESAFNPQARGRAGEVGLMQVTDAAAQEWAEAERVYPLPESHLLDPRTNTLAGAWYLRKLLRRYPQADNPVVFALADYNAGRGNVLKWMKGPATTNALEFASQFGFPTTRDYVEQVTHRRQHYAGDFSR
jgi:soluble lytic murein transglycosylase